MGEGPRGTWEISVHHAQPNLQTALKSQVYESK